MKLAAARRCRHPVHIVMAPTGKHRAAVIVIADDATLWRLEDSDDGLAWVELPPLPDFVGEGDA